MSQPDPRSPLSLGIAWAYRVSAVGLEFSLPTLGGYLLDRWWQTTPLLTLLGASLGFALGIVHLLQMARQSSEP